MIPLRRRRVTQGLVRSQVVVIRKPAGQAALRCQSIRVVLGIDVFLLDAPPEPLNEPVVDPPAPPIHADIHPRHDRYTRIGDANAR